LWRLTALWRGRKPATCANGISVGGESEEQERREIGKLPRHLPRVSRQQETLLVRQRFEKSVG
jgi:hypothetical protein